jgi:hypothetical protein
LSKISKSPLTVPHSTFNPSGLISTEHTAAASWVAVTVKSLKSKGWTLRKLSVDPVAQKYSLTAIERMGTLIFLYVYSSNSES